MMTLMLATGIAGAANVPPGLTGLWRFQNSADKLKATVGTDLINSDPANGIFYLGPWTDIGVESYTVRLILDPMTISATEKTGRGPDRKTATIDALRRSFIEGDPGSLLCVEFYADRAEDLPPRLQAVEEDLRQRGLGYRYHHAYDLPGQAKVWSLREAALGLSIGELIWRPGQDYYSTTYPIARALSMTRESLVTIVTS